MSGRIDITCHISKHPFASCFLPTICLHQDENANFITGYLFEINCLLNCECIDLEMDELDVFNVVVLDFRIVADIQQNVTKLCKVSYI